MNDKAIERLIEQVRNGRLSADEAVTRLRRLPVADLGFAQIDTHRMLRQGAPEIVYAPGKTPEQITAIVGELLFDDVAPVMVTRLDPGDAPGVLAAHADGEYLPPARLAVWRRVVAKPPSVCIAVVSAGTADAPVAAEAREVARALGSQVEMIEDVGVAGIHRIAACAPTLERADVVVVVAGMEGALASVVGGLVEVPVIAVPTSAGYGASFDGLAALLGMLTSCAAGVSVVNIDSGFGAAMAAFRLGRAARRVGGTS
jgi:pyridinium-3,5-biscarboxylic acid mononucleotide synthase